VSLDLFHSSLPVWYLVDITDMQVPESHRRTRSLSSVVDSAWNLASGSIQATTGWNPLGSVAQSSIIK
jgi:hypothetical protein